MTSKKKILIFSPSYNEISGGVVVLHKLCSILNQIGYQSFLHPHFESFTLHKGSYIKPIFDFMYTSFKDSVKTYKVNPDFNTPVLHNTKDLNWDEWVVVYPEVVFGNPLGAKNIVRWLLHNPGFHNGNIYYGKGELYFKFNSAILDFSHPGSHTSKLHLKVIHYPLNFYNTEQTSLNRSGTAYCIRKGEGKPMQHDIENSILIDGKSHKEVSEIFKRVERFISYDTLTAYSIFAALCDCDSVVIPDEGVSADEWYPDFRDRYGISYGLDNINIEEAAKTRCLVKERILKEHSQSVMSVKNAFQEVDAYFSHIDKQ